VAHFDSRQLHLYGGKLLYEIVVVCSKGRYSVRKNFRVGLSRDEVDDIVMRWSVYMIDVGGRITTTTTIIIIIIIILNASVVYRGSGRDYRCFHQVAPQ